MGILSLILYWPKKFCQSCVFTAGVLKHTLTMSVEISQLKLYIERRAYSLSSCDTADTLWGLGQ